MYKNTFKTSLLHFGGAILIARSKSDKAKALCSKE